MFESCLAKGNWQGPDRCAVGAAVVLSLGLSLLSVWTDDVLNRDGMLYVQAARVFVEQGIVAAFGAFEWPFLSMFIGAMHVVTGLSYLVAAQLLHAGLLAGVGGAFVLLYREVGGRSAWVAAAAIVISPFLNEYRAYVIRDAGYWCFGLWAVLFFTRFCQRGRSWPDALGWQVCVALAVAARIEAVALGALLPLYCGFLSSRRFLAWLRCNALFLVGLLSLVAFGFIEGIPLGGNKRVQVLGSYLSWSHYAGDFEAKAMLVAEYLQAAQALEDARAALVGGALAIFVRTVFWGLGLYNIPLLAGLWQGRLGRVWANPLPWAMAAVSLPVLVFTLRDMFLSGRYPGLLVLLLTLPATWALDEYLGRFAATLRKHPVWAGALALALAAYTLDGAVGTDHKKRYLREAAAWAEANIPKDARFYANEGALYFYSGRDYPHRPYDDEPLADLTREAGSYDWLMLRVSKKDVDRLDAVLKERYDLLEAARFENPRGDRVYVLRTGTSGE